MKVDAWLDRVRTLQPDIHGLSPQNVRRCLEGSVDAARCYRDHLDRPAPDHTVFVAAQTVFTASIEWIALLVGRGGRVTVKAPTVLSGWYAELCHGLDGLSATLDRDVIGRADRVVAMGSDATLVAIRDAMPEPDRLLGFGHRFSVAWWNDPLSADRVALDLVLHEGRGCMSPAIVFSPLADAGRILSDAMGRLCDQIPPGPLTGSVAAVIRERTMLARVVGTVHPGSGGNVLELPPTPLSLSPGPRTPVLIRVPTENAMLAALDGHHHRLSVIGTDVPLRSVGTSRTSPLGQMQLPPLDRLHDGVRWMDEV